MTLRAVRWLQQGRLTPFAAVIVVASLAAVLFAVARERGEDSRGIGSPAPRSPANGALALAAGESMTCIPTSAHATGAAGTNWRTDLEVHNPGTTQASYSIALLKHAEANTSPVTQSFTLGSGQSVRYNDVVYDRFAFNGKAALRVTATTGTVVVTSRTYNDQPAGSYGQFVPAFPDDQAIGSDREGRLIQLSHQPSAAAGGFRTNIGVVNAVSGSIAVTVDLYASTGAYLGQVPMTLRGYEYQQVDKVFERVTGGVVAGGYAVVRTATSGGRFFAYASVIDNRTGDPVFVPATSLARGAAPPPPTPTATTPPPTNPPGGTVNLMPYTPPGWANCVVCNYRQSSPPVYEVLYANQTTYVYWTIANFGTTTFSGPLKFGYYFDGARIFELTWSNPDGLLPGYYQKFLPASMTVYVTGEHTVEVRIDPDNAVAETGEADNSCSFNGYWGGAPLAAEGEAVAVPMGEAVAVGPPLPICGAPPADLHASQAAGAATYVATAAHVAGAAGTNWRTDLELHNPGTTTASVSIALLKHAADNSSPEGLSVTVPPGQAVRYADAVYDLFSFSGKAALRLEALTGSLVATSRTYNDQPGGTYGQFVPALPDGEAVSSDREGRLIQLSHQPNAGSGGFRTNVGVVNAGSGLVAVTIDLYASTGACLGQVPMTLRAYEYQQIDKVFERVTASVVSDGYAVVRTSTAGGRFFAYASVIDNRTGDPVFIPAGNLPRGSAPPTPTPTPTTTPGVITGPGGTSVTLPSGGTTPNAPVTITAGSGTYLPKSGEALVSTVIKVNVGGEGVSTGAGSYLVRIPVTGTVSDPSKLLLKVQTSVGPVYPVAGVYDSGTKVFTAELMSLWDGWNMGVVTNPNLQVLAAGVEEIGTVRALGWETPEDWKTCGWKIMNLALGAPPTFKTDISQALGPACEHLRNARFRSPKLWLDSRYPPPRRIAWLVQGLGPKDPKTSFASSPDEDKAEFSTVGFDDAQMQALGQLYFNWDAYQLVSSGLGITLKNTVMHELFHAVQAGYDVRGRFWETKDSADREIQNDTRLWFKEGTATLIGSVYEANPNGLQGGTVTVRTCEQAESLSEVMPYWTGRETYTRQDFFAYFAARYNAGAFLNLRELFQALGDSTTGQFEKSDDEYRTLYRRGMDKHYSEAFGVTLPDLYTNFAIDRAYRHTNPAILRASDLLLQPNSLDRKLFYHTDDSGTVFNHVTDWDPATTPSVTEKVAGHISGLKPLQTWAVKVTVPQAAQTAGSLTIAMAVSGAPLGHQGVRIFVFRETGNVMVPGGEMEITDISQPVHVPVSSSIGTLTILVVNGSVENTPAYVTLGQHPWNKVSSGDSRAHSCMDPPLCTQNCDFWGGGTNFRSPLTWQGNTFSYALAGWGTLSGTLSTDGKTLLAFTWKSPSNETLIDWHDLPLIAARSTSELAIFGAYGEAARSHITTWCGCGSFSCGWQINYELPVTVEVWLAK